MCIEGRAGVKVDASRYAHIFEASEQWPEISNWRRYDWLLVKDVPISELEYSTLAEYEAAAETDPEEEAWENIDRVNEIISILKSGAPRWPVVLGLDCMVLDGYHRLSASNELGIETVDVLHPTKRRAGRLSGSEKSGEAISLAKRAANHLYLQDPEFVQGGCSDVSEVLAAWLKTRGYAAEPVYGIARRGKKAGFMHAWMLIEGELFDPVLWVQDFPVHQYKYKLAPDVAQALRCDVEYIVESEIEGLDRAFPL